MFFLLFLLLLLVDWDFVGKGKKRDRLKSVCWVHQVDFVRNTTCHLFVVLLVACDFVDTIISHLSYHCTAGHIQVPLHNFKVHHLNHVVAPFYAELTEWIYPKKIFPKKVIYLRNWQSQWNIKTKMTYLMVMMGMIRRLTMVHICIAMPVVLCQRTMRLKWTSWLSHHI